MPPEGLTSDMLSGPHNAIVINGIRYHVAIRLDTSWNYTTEYRHRGIDDAPESLSKAEQEAVDEISRANLRQEPWLHVEIA
jgi:hypothetical protein